MKFRRESKYGLLGLIYLAQLPPGRVMGAREIAAHEGLPQVFLAKIFPKFVQHGLVTAHRGSTRGYSLAKSPEEIRLREILEAIEGPQVTSQCFFWGSECNVTNPCPVHCQWRAVRPWIEEILERTTLKDLILKDQLIREATEKPSPRPEARATATAEAGG